MKRFLLYLLFISNCAYSQVVPKSNKPQHEPPVIINSYTEVLSFDKCTNAITVANDSSFKIGDTVLLIQMKGAVMDTSNTASFGTILDYKNAGNYEFNYISQKSGNTFTLKNKLTKTYDIPDGVVQLIRVPSPKNAYFVSGLTCLPWDGTKGGVLAVIARNGLISSDVIDVTGLGFRGGEGFNAVLPPSNCFENNYKYPDASQLAACKGEGIAVISQSMKKGKGSPAGGGGGGESHNSGGGGGANAGAGGYGGYQTDTCGNAPFDNRGIGAKNYLYNSGADKIFMGGGGGAGHTDNNSNLNTPLSGGNGGGIVIIITDSLTMNGHPILADGNDATYCYSSDCNDGMGGAGAGGTVLMSLIKVLDNSLSVETMGGNGRYVIAPITPGGRVGPGGGGGGGAFFINSPSLPANINVSNAGGINGTIVLDANNPWGATKGLDGLKFYNLKLPFDTILFKPNIDSVRISDSLLTCNSFDFKGLAYTNTNPIISWYWNFSDGNTANTQNVNHTFLSQNNFVVKLIATDVNGCKDSSSLIVTPQVISIDAGPDKSFCSNIPVSIILNGSGTGTYSWTPAQFLNDSTQLNPIATIDTTTTFYFTITSNNCPVRDSVKIIVNRLPVLTISKSNDINCVKPYANLKATGASQYLWTPSSTLSSSISANPIANPSVSTTYVVTAGNNNGCFARDSITVNVSRSGGNLVLPNSFTPNGDGLNDCFGIKYYRDVQDLTFMIFDRFGTKIFETHNAGDCWDGTYKKVKLDPAVFVYFLKAKTPCGDVSRKGTVMLIR